MSNENVLKRFSERLTQIRKEKGLTQEALALKSDIDRTYIGRIESMKRNPSLVVLDKIAKGLDIKLADLMDI